MKKNKLAWEYFSLALYAFAGLGIEMLLLSVAEPWLFGNSNWREYTTAQSIVHWLLTSGCWVLTAYLLIRTSKHRLDFDVLSKNHIEKRDILICCGLVVFCIVLNAFDWGTLKIAGEMQKKGLLRFTFQYIYYFAEVGLVFLIIAFGQKFFETLFQKKSNIPWGGVVLACTWGAVHVLTKGNLADGLGTMIFGVLFGMMYISLKKNAGWSYVAMAAAFMI